MPRRLPLLALVVLAAGCGGGGTQPAGRLGLGSWGYRADPRNVGLEEGWARRALDTEPIAVPGRPPEQAAIAGRAGARAYAGSVGWWQAPLTVARDGVYAIGVGSANREARLWVDGRPRCAHTGAYMPFRCLARLRAGRHRVTMRLDWRDPGRARAEGHDRAWFNWGGLAWPVSVRRVGELELSEPRIATRLRGGRARVTVLVDVQSHARGAVTARVGGVLRRGSATVALRFGARRLARGEIRRVRATATVRDPALWSPRRPRLYRLELRAAGAEPLRLGVGLRELRWSASGLALNGRALRLHGAELPPDAAGHGDALTVSDEARIVAELRAAGANSARAQFPLSDRFLRRLDAAGILVWQEIGPFTKAGDWHGTAEDARHRALETAVREQPHPSVAVWSLVNEAAGQGRADGQVEYVRTTASALHGIDPGRPVGVGIWGPHPPRAPGPMYEPLDVLGTTDYVGWYDDADAPPATQDAVALQRLRALRALFPGKLLVVGEVGAGANAQTPAAARGGFGYQARLLQRRLTAYGREPGLGGVLVFALRDYALRPSFAGGRAARLGYRGTPGINDKGLFTYAGRPKPAARAVRRAFSPG